jgi:hypothetical protein
MDTSILGQCPDVDMPESFDAWIQSLATPENIVEAEYCMDFRSYDGMMKAHDWALTKHVPGMLLSAREMDPGIWISRNVRLHPLARLVPPVYIGEDCRVESGVNLGPGVVVGSRSIIDAGTVAENAVIFPGTYVGEALELKDAIIDRNCLVNVRLESGTLIRDSFILYSAEGARVKNGVYRFMERVVAAILLITLWPLPLVLSVLAFMRGGKWQAFDAVSTPAEQHASLWRTFSIHHIVISPTDAPSSCGHLFRVCGWFIPGLLRVVLGDLSLVGMPARGRKELFALSESWRNMCLSTKSGLISEAEVAGAGDSLDLQYTADAFYATRAGFRHDIRLFVKYLMGAGRSLPGPAEEGMNRDQ